MTEETLPEEETAAGEAETATGEVSEVVTAAPGKCIK
jgi:hypothetical protein